MRLSPWLYLSPLAALSLPLALAFDAAAATERLDRINPKDMPRFDYLTHVVVAKDQRQVAHIAGQSSMNVNMNIEGETLAQQLPVALANFDLALKAVGAKRVDVAQMTVFYVDKTGDGAAQVTRAIRDYFAPGAAPAVSYVGVNSLVSPAMRVEIEGMALPSEGT